MGTTFEQFAACLRNPAARRLIGVDLTDEEASALLADPEAASAYFGIWSATRHTSPVKTQAPPPRARPAPVQTLLDVWTFGKGSSRVHIHVTTASLELASTSGTSIWKSFLGAATLGASLVVTGITVKAGGELHIPIHLVDAAFISKGGSVYSTLKVVVQGEAAEFSVMTLAAATVASVINAAKAGGTDADFCARAWKAHQAGQGRTWPSERDLKKMFRAGKISQRHFEHEVAMRRHLTALGNI